MEDHANAEREARAADRRSWPVRVYRLGEEPEDDLLERTTAPERIAMVWSLTLDAWTLAGRLIPDYPRSEAPIRVIRTGIRSAQDDDPGEPG